MIARQPFFNKVRTTFFNGKLSQGHVDGMNAILSEWDDKELKDKRYLAYMLATVYHETAKTMQPIKEYGFGNGRKYGVPDPVTGHRYYGRGFVQLTWNYNYQRVGEFLGVDLYNDPDLALDKHIATKILFAGMMLGLFTGKKLSQYFNDKKTDWVNARRIINGLDRAELIAGYAKKFYQIVKS